MKDDSPNCIERGCIVNLNEHGDDAFLILHISKSNHVKWFPTKEKPSWTFTSSFKKKKYRVALRKVKVVLHSDDAINGAAAASIQVLTNDEIIDGMTVRQTYRMMSISQIRHLVMKIDT